MMIETRKGRVFKCSNGNRTPVDSGWLDNEWHTVDDGLPARKPYPNAARHYIEIVDDAGKARKIDCGVLLDEQEYLEQKKLLRLLRRFGVTITEMKEVYGLSNATYKALERGRLRMPDSMKTVLERLRDRRGQSA